MDLAEFITARLDEDEAAARLDGPDDPDAPPLGRRFTSAFNDDGQVIERLHGPIEIRPARILAQVEAMRQIVAEYTAALAISRSLSGNALQERVVQAGAWAVTDTARSAVAHLATIWRDHPSYDPAWEV